MTEPKLDAILARQLPDAEKRARADLVLKKEASHAIQRFDRSLVDKLEAARRDPEGVALALHAWAGMPPMRGLACVRPHADGWDACS